MNNEAELMAVVKAARPFARVVAAMDFYIPEAMPFGNDGSIYFPREGTRITDGPGFIGIDEDDFRRLADAFAKLDARNP